MTQQLQTLVEAARALPLRDKLELLQIITGDLQQTLMLNEASESFWQTKSVEELAAQQSTPVVTDIRALTADFWPEEESADEFNQFIGQQRRNDLERESLSE